MVHHHRGWRRHQAWRLKRRYEKFVRNVQYPDGFSYIKTPRDRESGADISALAAREREEFERYVEDAVRSHWKNRCRCSCWMCGNARRYLGETLQERRSSDSMRQQLDAWEDEQLHYDDWS